MHRSQIFSHDNIEESDLTGIADQVFLQLHKNKHFCLWLEGEMGAGKTTFTRYLLQNFGLDKRIPVTSPTFAYLNEYLIDERLFAHIDLYRLDQKWDPEELGLHPDKEFFGVIVEWPQNGSDEELLKPSHILEIYHPSLDQRTRDYKFYEIKNA